jgi:hypothetical protein
MLPQSLFILMESRLPHGQGCLTENIIGCESGQVSFTDLKIESDGYIKSLYVLDWKIISGTWAIDQKVLQGDASVIFIISNALYLQLLHENNVEYTIMKTVRYPDGEVAFWVIMMPP